MKTKEIIISDSSNNNSIYDVKGKNLTNEFISASIFVTITIFIALCFAYRIYPKPKVVIDSDEPFKRDGVKLKKVPIVYDAPSGYLD